MKATVAEITGKVSSRNPVIGSPEESDGVIVPEKSANNGTAFPAESMEGRTPAERKSTTAARLRTQSRSNLSNGNRWLRRRRRRDGFRRKSLPTSSALKVGATCGSSARVDLRGGHPATGVPTATFITRNRLICEPLYLAHYIERAGTGTLDMIRLCREAALPEP